jgi:FkbM family methyltransferase
MKSLVSRALKAIGAFDAARTIKWRFDSQQLRSHRSRALKFYRKFISVGDLCFDIGANVGARTDVFWMLGARVVAVEPLPECIHVLQRLHDHHEKIKIVATAVGAEPGEAELFVNDNLTVVSTLSEDWRAAVVTSGRLSAGEWNRHIKVAVTTLDALIAEHGRPDFCKIDVEGFERQVLIGLTQEIPRLSFEFTQERLEDVGSCIEQLDSFGDYIYNFAIGEKFELQLNTSCGPARLIDVLSKRLDGKHCVSGDIYAVTKGLSK